MEIEPSKTWSKREKSAGEAGGHKDEGINKKKRQYLQCMGRTRTKKPAQEKAVEMVALQWAA